MTARFNCACLRQALDVVRKLRNTLASEHWRGLKMLKQDIEFDFCRYRNLLAGAVDEPKRLALINLLVEERAKERLAAQRASDRSAMTATVVAKVLRASRT